ncbi:uncharacterized protein EDB91DRAFT_1106436 [Suillus paluster]|uniref:uncharacterized protein n=1 Tax=Suillus paluster TaxID=48578 RepID=UPI001B8866F3|nr:uncharacterized protein EDB91DRAFT_1106436 [Suillus paluster]KAG1751636.1 hypothetical protein EDB91DRAFT_1106436 [Suillus paluster]
MYLKSLKDSGKVFANGRTRRDGSIPADTPSPVPVPSSTLPSNSSPGYSDSAGGEPGLEGSTNYDGPSAGYSRGLPDMAQLALPLVQAVVGAIPLVGPSMQAAIGGLLTSLQAIDRHNQNKADLNSLALRLDRLSRDLCNAPPARDSLEQSRRDSFVRMLQDTSARSDSLSPGCFIDIDRYLAEYLVVFQSLKIVCIHSYSAC